MSVRLGQRTTATAREQNKAERQGRQRDTVGPDCKDDASVDSARSCKKLSLHDVIAVLQLVRKPHFFYYSSLLQFHFLSNGNFTNQEHASL